MEFSRLLDEKVIVSLCKELKLDKERIFYSEGPLDMSFLSEISDKLRNYKELFYQRRVPQNSRYVDNSRSMRSQIEKKDILLSYPYESMQPFLRLLNEASEDEDVISIKMTLYRVAKNSQVVEALINAAENGKEVVVLVELRARFDEENNIEWSHRLEDAGCRIIYGIDFIKVHSKLCLITYREDDRIKHITQIGTGNYNEKTAKLYTDLSLMTSNESIAVEAAEVFNRLCMEEVVENSRHLLIAPKCLQNRVIEYIEKEITYADMGEEAYIGVKVNSLTDKTIMDKLVEASMHGVHIDLVVRGICCLIPGVEGYTDNIRVISIVGRYLEHSRVYIFGTKERDSIFISSADFMTRNTVKRVEVAAPIYDAELKARIREGFDIMLRDTAKARILCNDGNYYKRERKDDREESIGAQQYFSNEAYLAASKNI
jgi:polyphosphate kinase